MGFFGSLRGNHFIKNVVILSVGSLAAQIITIVASPLLTRLYSPADFGSFAVFMAIVSSLIPTVSGKYEIALVLPKSDRDGQQLFGIAALFAIVFSVTLLGCFHLFHDWFLAILNAEKLSGWLYLVPLSLLLTGFFQLCGYMANRFQDYKLIACSKLVQAVTAVYINVVLGLYGVGFLGLILGNVIAMALATGYMLYRYREKVSGSLIGHWQEKKTLAMHYIDYPIYNASTGLLNGVTAALPIFFLTHYYPEAIVGYFALIQRVANVPLSFVSSAISQVNLKKVIELANNGDDIVPYILKITLVLLALVILPFLIIVLYSPVLFSFVFGEEWNDAGVYAQILMPAMAVRFIVSTLSSTLGATKNNQLGAVWRVCAFVVTLLVFALYAPQGDIISLFIVMAITDIFLYVVYYGMILVAAKRPKNLA